MGQVTHGRTYSKIYRTWTAMKSRCRNPNDPNYFNYGGRGLTVCDEWNSFEKFLEDMGELPFPEAEIDRIDNDLGYFKENCRWVTKSENSRNRRTTKRHSTNIGKVVQQELIEKIGWTKSQFRWFRKKYGISWILDGFANGTLPERTNHIIDREDIVGKTFAEWTVLAFSSYIKKDGHLYLCRCSCGKERYIPRNNLIRGKTTCCRKCSALKFWEKRNKST